MPGPVPEWATTLANAERAVSTLRERFPDATATIEFEGEQSDLNLPHAADYQILRRSGIGSVDAHLERTKRGVQRLEAKRRPSCPNRHT
jgi:hypothetical protein